MPPRPDQRPDQQLAEYRDRCPDPAAGVLLAAEAAVLEARVRLLREALAGVDARIAAVTEELRRPAR
jgi:hypothetical protein